MKIEINSDIDKYKETIALGLNARQMVFSILALGVGTGIVLGLCRAVGMTAAVYIAIPFVAPIGLAGFYNFRGMNFYEVSKKRLCFSFRSRPLLYHSVSEGKRVVDAYQRELFLLEKQKLKESRKRRKKAEEELPVEEQVKAAERGLARTAVFSVLLAVLLAAGLAAYKMGWLEKAAAQARGLLNEYF